MNILWVFNEYVVISLLLLLVSAGIFIARRMRRKKEKGAKKATGVILALEKLALSEKHEVEVKILVMVMPEKSRNFVGELIETVLLTDLLLLKIGDKIAVEYAASSKLMLSRLPNKF